MLSRVPTASLKFFWLHTLPYKRVFRRAAMWTFRAELLSRVCAFSACRSDSEQAFPELWLYAPLPPLYPEQGILEVSIFGNGNIHPLLFFFQREWSESMDVKWSSLGSQNPHNHTKQPIPKKVSSCYFINRTCKWFKTKMRERRK